MRGDAYQRGACAPDDDQVSTRLPLSRIVSREEICCCPRHYAAHLDTLGADTHGRHDGQAGDHNATPGGHDQHRHMLVARTEDSCFLRQVRPHEGDQEHHREGGHRCEPNQEKDIALVPHTERLEIVEHAKGKPEAKKRKAASEQATQRLLPD